MIIAVMTAICVIGTELSAQVQRVMIFAQVGALLLFAVVALIKGGALRARSARAVVVLAVRVDSPNALVLGRADGGVHLLGLGERREPQRGD